MTNTAAPGTLILLGSQTNWAYSEFIRRATDPLSPAIHLVGVDHYHTQPPHFQLRR